MQNQHFLRGMATVNFWAADVATARDWYTQLLGLEPYFQQPNPQQPAYVEFRLGDYEAEFGIIDRNYAPKAMQPGPGGAILLWHVDDVEAAFARLLALGAKEYDPITKRGDSGFVTASVIDPFGNILGIMQNPHYLKMLGLQTHEKLMATLNELPTLPFASVPLLEKWLSKHHAQLPGLWIKMAKKESGIASVTHDEALEVALCYGWIDGQRNACDTQYFLQKFTPRRPKSLWSKRNIEKVAALTAAGRMQPFGLAQVAAAQQDGRWAAAYESQKNMVIPEDFWKALKKNKPALAYYNTLRKSNRYRIALRLATAKKPETRQRRLEAILAMLERGEFR